MRTMDGFVTLVQESRFQLVDDQGIGHLFVLSHSASAEPAQLGPLQRRQAHVRVSYKSAPDLIANIAHAIALHPSAS